MFRLLIADPFRWCMYTHKKVDTHTHMNLSLSIYIVCTEYIHIFICRHTHIHT